MKDKPTLSEVSSLLSYYRQKADLTPPQLSQLLGKQKNYCWRVENYGSAPKADIALEWLVHCNQTGMDVVFEYFSAVAKDRAQLGKGTAREDTASRCLEILLAYLQNHGYIDRILELKAEPQTLTEAYIAMFPGRESLQALLAECVRHKLDPVPYEALFKASESLLSSMEEPDLKHISRQVDIALGSLAEGMQRRQVEKGYAPELGFLLSEKLRRML